MTQCCSRHSRKSPRGEDRGRDFPGTHDDQYALSVRHEWLRIVSGVWGAGRTYIPIEDIAVF